MAARPVFAPLSLGLLLFVVAGCSDRPPPPASPTPAANPAGETTKGETTCARDADCTGDWHPQMPGCGPIERCFGGACITPPAVSGEANPETARLVIETPGGERTYQVEVVDDRFEISRGLMCRQSMKRDWGMLFLMESARVQRFWMFNTLIPLDMVFISESWSVVGVVANAEPQTRTGRSVNANSRYVLELVGGEAARAGIATKAKVRFYPPQPPE